MKKLKKIFTQNLNGEMRIVAPQRDSKNSKQWYISKEWKSYITNYTTEEKKKRKKGTTQDTTKINKKLHEEKLSSVQLELFACFNFYFKNNVSL